MDLDSKVLDIDADVYNYLSKLGDEVGHIYHGDLLLTNTGEFSKNAIRRTPDGKNEVRFALLHSENTSDNKSNQVRVVTRTHPYEFEVFIQVDQKNVQASYLERRRVGQLVMDHIANVDRVGRYIDVLYPASLTVRTPPEDIFNHLCWRLVFSFTVGEAIARSHIGGRLPLT